MAVAGAPMQAQETGDFFNAYKQPVLATSSHGMGLALPISIRWFSLIGHPQFPFFVFVGIRPNGSECSHLYFPDSVLLITAQARPEWPPWVNTGLRLIYGALPLADIGPQRQALNPSRTLQDFFNFFCSCSPHSRMSMLVMTISVLGLWLTPTIREPSQEMISRPSPGCLP